MAGQKEHRRTLRVLVTALAIEDGQTAPPAVGEVGIFPLVFEEADADDADPTISVISAEAEPEGDGRPDAQDPPVWPIFLRGDGWSALWRSARPAIGRVRLTGRLHGELGYTTDGSARGLITRVRVVSDSYTPAGGSGGPQLISEARRLREVRVSPGNFRDDVLFRPPAAAEPHLVRECGALVDLDLDAAPEPAVRLELIPGALSACEGRLWIADQQLPLVVERSVHSPDARHILSGQILARAAAESRRVHADAGGCWVAGWDGVHRCRLDGAVQRLSERTIGGSADAEGTLLTYGTDQRGHAALTLWHADGRGGGWEIADEKLVSIGSGPDGFLVALRDSYGIGPDTGRLIRVGADGSITEGPILPDVPARGTVVAVGPPRIFDGEGGFQSIREDLTLGPTEPCPIEGLGITVAGRWLAVLHHDESRPLGDNRRYWLLSVFDAATLDRAATVEVSHASFGIAVAGDDALWISDHGVRRVALG